MFETGDFQTPAPPESGVADNDVKLAESRDKKTYRGKGKRKTSIKTVYGEVEYRRTVYRTKTKQPTGSVFCAAMRRNIRGAAVPAPSMSVRTRGRPGKLLQESGYDGRFGIV